eukprot:Clim_evm50s148 gene=Clim_evmTU50s148
MTQRQTRIGREMKRLVSGPPDGVTVHIDTTDDVSSFDTTIQGPDNSNLRRHSFRVGVKIGPRYPFEPPSVWFKSPVYHPNIDRQGRICLEILKLPPKGAWKPSLNIHSVLAAVRILLGEPNPDDALMADIAAEFRTDPALYHQKSLHFASQHSSVTGNSEDSTQTTTSATAATSTTTVLKDISNHHPLLSSASMDSSSPALKRARNDTEVDLCTNDINLRHRAIRHGPSSPRRIFDSQSP